MAPKGDGDGLGDEVADGELDAFGGEQGVEPFADAP